MFLGLSNEFPYLKTPADSLLRQLLDFSDEEDSEETKPSNTVSSLIPDTSNAETTDKIIDKNDNELTKKRRSFIPIESKLEVQPAYETETKETADSIKADAVESETSGDVHSVASGGREESATENDSQESAVSGSAEGTE